jgi:hypothetical protein
MYVVFKTARHCLKVLFLAGPTSACPTTCWKEVSVNSRELDKFILRLRGLQAVGQEQDLDRARLNLFKDSMFTLRATLFAKVGGILTPPPYSKLLVSQLITLLEEPAGVLIH